MQHVIVLLDIAGAKANIDAIIRDGDDQARILTFEEPDGAAAAAEGLWQARRRNLDEEPAPIIVAAAGGADTEGALTAIRLVRAITQRVPLLLVVEERLPEDVCIFGDAGIDDFVYEPVGPASLRTRLQRLLHHYYRTDPVASALAEKLSLAGIVGDSRVLLEQAAKIPLFARFDSTVLIDGETGTGKEVWARAIHYLSPRADKPFVPVNCGAIPLELSENELFGHERAAFTGASASSRGLVAEAEGGTLFLDEIDSLPPKAQVKLLRLLQEKEYRPLGSARQRKADIRFIAATNRDLEYERKRGQFRDDFFYRISVLRVTLPPLRERGDDTLKLAEHFVGKSAREARCPLPRLTAAAKCALRAYGWPGNVRELQHVIERAVILSHAGPVIDIEQLGLPPNQRAESLSFQGAKKQAIDHFEVSFLEMILGAYNGNVAQAAHAIGKHPRALRELLRKHEIDLSRFRERVD